MLSVYLNLDPSEFPTQRDRKIEVESLLDVAERALRDDGLPHQQKDELKQDVERIRAWFDGEFDASGARGVAVFASSGADLFEVHRLSRPVRSEVTIDDSPFIEPLAGMPGDDGYGVLLINRKVARILAGGADRMREVISFADDVHPLARPGRLVPVALPARHREGGEGPPQARQRRAVQALQARRGAAPDHRLPRRDARGGRAHPPQLPA